MKKSLSLKSRNSLKTFKCLDCGKDIPLLALGTKHRNHCCFCLSSLHLDSGTGDRESSCKGIMKAIGLTFKDEGLDKYGKKKQGELRIIHECVKCKKKSVNRIAGDDNPDSIIKVFKKSINKNKPFLSQEDEKEVYRQLFGKNEV